MESNHVLENFKVEEIFGNHYNATGNKILYLIKWIGYQEESKSTEEPIEQMPRALVGAYNARHAAATMDGRLRRRTRGA